MAARRRAVETARAPFIRPSRIQLELATHVPSAASMLELQRSAGNAAVGGIVAQLKPAPVVSPPGLSIGARGAAVMDLQQKLNALGAHPTLAVDGKFGGKTRRAVKVFQTAHASDGLKPTGVVDDDTHRVLRTIREIDANEKELGQRIAQDAMLANQPGTAESGLFYAENYRRRFGNTAKGKSLTADDYAKGYADPTYFERLGYWDWRVKPRVSASEAIRSFLRGLTIAECNSVAGASYMDAVRAALGDARFDELYGSADHDVPEARRLRLGPLTASTHPSVEAVIKRFSITSRPGGIGTIGHRPVEVGEWYYFQNHPKYKEKHPHGSWQGENAIYLGIRGGGQHWSGFGANDVSERYMLNKLVSFYNRPAPGWTGEPKTITVATLIAAGGGLQTNGIEIDADKVKHMR